MIYGMYKTECRTLNKRDGGENESDGNEDVKYVEMDVWSNGVGWDWR